MNTTLSKNGILVVDKPQNMTSRDVVNYVSKILNIKKIGHTGTLDPLATGVLVLTIGKYTKLTEVLTSNTKEYIATFTLGYETDSLDVTGKIIKRSNKKVEDSLVSSTCLSFIRTYNQEVPLYSAVKINGHKLYEYARNNIKIDLPKREITIKNIEILSIKDNIITIKCLVSKGTYIRSLVRDIGLSLGTYATLISLRRISQGKFTLKDAYTLEDIKNNNYKLLSLEETLDIETIKLTDTNLKKQIENGSKLKLNNKSNYILFTYDSTDIALYKKDNDIYRMFIKLI